MLYTGENPIVRIVDVAHMRWRGGTFHVAPRQFSALALRIAGTATVTADGREYAVTPRDIFYLPQGVAYTARCTDTEMLVVHFLTETADAAPEVYPFADREQMTAAFRRMLTIWKEQKPSGVYATAQLYHILTLICDNEVQRRLPPRFSTAVAYIHGQFCRADLSVADICENAGIGATQLRVLFRQYYQKSPIAYITALRLQHARGLIADGATVEAAATESGFSDAKYFARTVKKCCGCTPRSWRLYGE